VANHKFDVIQGGRNSQRLTPQDSANKRWKDIEIVKRWQLRQSIETMSRRMHLGTLYVQAVLRENFVAILPPLETASSNLRRVA